MGLSVADMVRDMTEQDRVKFLSSFTEEEAAALNFNWNFWARPEQLTPEEDFYVWLILAGRGWGKTRTGAEFIKQRVQQGKGRYIALVGRTWADGANTMIEGESGLLSLYPAHAAPEYNKNKGKLVWPESEYAPRGAQAQLFTAEVPKALRGPQHDTFWGDEIAAWESLEAWDQLRFGLRLRCGGHRACGVITTTPRPIPLLRDWVRASLRKDQPSASRVVVTKGVTWDNSNNLDPNVLEALRETYENTRLGRQELHAEILDDNPGALWKRKDIDEPRVAKNMSLSPTELTESLSVVEVVVAIDPAVTCKEGASDETGIIVAGVTRDKQAFVLEDLSGTYTPDEWGKVAMRAYIRWKAKKIVAEVNQGGDMVQTNLRACADHMGISWFGYEAVRATKGKAVRAEPVAALYEQHRVHHVGNFPALEDQMCDWNPQDTKAESPDRMDALVWALTYLIINKPVIVTYTESYSLGLY